ncbi:hypothetical protein AWC38_SpisGene24119 [Stylophora pistillata]|uniref:Uncharacterized protein n=1 Tax=Stylophora pistillata TaxID=50429 RepID=A0A2B4R6Y1_STYPI|nr:hypothetical protein AWC38_SpisGene24119 [Stylophora pistillata]
MPNLQHAVQSIRVVDNARAGCHPFQVGKRGPDIIFSDPQNRKIDKYTIESSALEDFGRGNEDSVEGPLAQRSFRPPCGIDIEFDNVLYKTDAMSGTSALGLIHNSRVFLEENEQAIYHDVNTHLSKTLSGPHGNVAGKTIDTVRLVEWRLNRLNEVTKQLNYHENNLLSCMTLDVEHFHSTIHVKSDVMSMLQYYRSFGNCVKENVNRLSAWGAFYFTHLRSWYPLPEGSIQFQEMPTMKPLPARELSLDGCQRLTELANVYGGAVRQRYVRQEMTRAKAGTLPSACYETNLPVQRVMLSRDDIHDDSKAPLQPVESNSEDSSGESEDEDENIEFDSDESVENDGSEDDTRTKSYDEPQLAPEALFLVER